jgi:hypothetical protein
LLFEFTDTGFESVERINDAFKALIILLALDAGLHPTVDSPERENDYPKFHGASGRGLLAMFLIELVYRKSGSGSGTLEKGCPGSKY